jgi:hypothetical protein
MVLVSCRLVVLCWLNAADYATLQTENLPELNTKALPPVIYGVPLRVVDGQDGIGIKYNFPT